MKQKERTAQECLDLARQTPSPIIDHTYYLPIHARVYGSRADELAPFLYATYMRFAPIENDKPNNYDGVSLVTYTDGRVIVRVVINRVVTDIEDRPDVLHLLSSAGNRAITMNHPRNKVQGASFDEGEVEALVAGFAHSGYKFREMASGKVAVIHPDNTRVDHATLASAMQSALRRMYWHLQVTSKAIALEKAQKELDEAVQKLEKLNT